MARTRVSTTVDESLLETARGLKEWPNDSSLIDAALAALVSINRANEVDAAYRAYDGRPLDEPDDWGDLASFRAAAGST